MFKGIPVLFQCSKSPQVNSKSAAAVVLLQNLCKDQQSFTVPSVLGSTVMWILDFRSGVTVQKMNLLWNLLAVVCFFFLNSFLCRLRTWPLENPPEIGWVPELSSPWRDRWKQHGGYCSFYPQVFGWQWDDTSRLQPAAQTAHCEGKWPAGCWVRGKHCGLGQAGVQLLPVTCRIPPLSAILAEKNGSNNAGSSTGGCTRSGSNNWGGEKAGKLEGRQQSKCRRGGGPV